jgi:FkbM family methyltransferase
MKKEQRFTDGQSKEPREQLPPKNEQIYRFDSEVKEQLLVRSLVKPGMTVFDVGANVGKYTKLFSQLVGPRGRVFAFEPDPESASKVRELAKRDELTNVTVVEAAVCDESGKLTLNQFPREYCTWNSLGRPQMEDPRKPTTLVPIVSTVEVAAVTIDDFCAAQGIEKIDYLKLDVEGAEFRALCGAKQTLSSRKIDQLQFEVSRKMLEGLNTTAKPVFDFLAQHGYFSQSITKEGTPGPRVSDSAAFYENYIATPEAATAGGSAGDPLPVHFFTLVLNGRPFIQ